MRGCGKAGGMAPAPFASTPGVTLPGSRAFFSFRSSAIQLTDVIDGLLFVTDHEPRGSLELCRNVQCMLSSMQFSLNKAGSRQDYPLPLRTLLSILSTAVKLIQAASSQPLFALQLCGGGCDSKRLANGLAQHLSLGQRSAGC